MGAAGRNVKEGRGVWRAEGGRFTSGVSPKTHTHTHHELSCTLTEKEEVFAFSFGRSQSPPFSPLCLRPLPLFPRYAVNQWEAENAPHTSQSTASCYVRGRIDKRELPLFPFPPFCRGSHYSWFIGWKQDCVACQATYTQRYELLHIRWAGFPFNSYPHSRK